MHLNYMHLLWRGQDDGEHEYTTTTQAMIKSIKYSALKNKPTNDIGKTSKSGAFMSYIMSQNGNQVIINDHKNNTTRKQVQQLEFWL